MFRLPKLGEILALFHVPNVATALRRAEHVIETILAAEAKAQRIADKYRAALVRAREEAAGLESMAAQFDAEARKAVGAANAVAQAIAVRK